MNYHIHIRNETRHKVRNQLLRNILKKSLDFFQIKQSAEIGLLLVDDKFIKKLNEEYRGEAKPTDVLTFGIFDNKHQKIDAPDKIIHLGDIVISLDQVIKQSGQNNISVINELANLIIHGVLHIFGFSHETKKIKYNMDKAARKIFESVKKDII